MWQQPVMAAANGGVGAVSVMSASCQLAASVSVAPQWRDQWRVALINGNGVKAESLAKAYHGMAVRLLKMAKKRRGINGVSAA
jgi:hypothetical protein